MVDDATTSIATNLVQLVIGSKKEIAQPVIYALAPHIHQSMLYASYKPQRAHVGN
jgi:hypothetical protein